MAAASEAGALAAEAQVAGALAAEAQAAGALAAEAQVAVLAGTDYHPCNTHPPARWTRRMCICEEYPHCNKSSCSY